MAQAGIGGQPSFESSWPPIADCLRAVLARKGTPSWLADDIVQETAVRLLLRWEAVDKGAPLLPLAITVARNLLTDHHRAWSRLANQDPDIATTRADTVENAALARLELEKVGRALEGLYPRYRDVLLAEIGEAPISSASRFARNSARKRARDKLAILLQSMRGIVISTAAATRRRSRRLSVSTSRATSMSTLDAFAQVAAAVIISLVISGGAGLYEPEGDPQDAKPGGGLALVGGRTSEPEDRDSTSITTRQDYTTHHPRDGHASPDAVIAASPKLPHSKGRTTNTVAFGAEGYDIQNAGSTTTAGQEISWRQRHRFRSPDCVQEAAAGHVPQRCGRPEGPSGYVEIGAAGQRRRVRYGP